MATFGSLLTNVKYRCSIQNESSYDTALKLWLNDGQRDILNRYLWDFTRTYEDISTVASTVTYTLTNPGVIYDVRNTTSLIPLSYLGDLDFDRLFPNQSATGTPRYFRSSGQTQTSSSTQSLPTISLYPIPDAVYTIRVRFNQRFSDLSDSADISAIPATYHELLVNYACNVFFSSQGDNRAIEYYTKYENGLAAMAEQLNAQPVSKIDILRSTDDAYGGDVVRLPSSYGTNASW